MSEEHVIVVQLGYLGQTDNSPITTHKTRERSCLAHIWSYILLFTWIYDVADNSGGPVKSMAIVTSRMSEAFV